MLHVVTGLPAWAVWLGGAAIAVVYACIFYYIFVSPFNLRWRAIFGEPDYPDDYEVRGIDISHYQDNISWPKLQDAKIGSSPLRFIIIKATEGEELMDDNFNENFYLSHKHGFVRGAYHFFVPGKDPLKQARFFLKQVHLEPGDLPPVLDVEKKGSLTKAQLVHDVKVWLNEVEGTYGVKPILYTGAKFKQDYLDDKQFDAYPLWLAHYYVDKPSSDVRWTLWQYTDCGRVSGIKGFVDLNFFSGSIEQFYSLTLEDIP